jgi:Leucine-rich repeat (LRR) protein
MPALQEVDLSGNQIEDISPLQYTNSRLRDINLDGNRILTPGYSLQRPVPLRRLYLQNNEISVDHEYFKGLTEHLYLFGNPLSENVNCDRCYTKKYQFNF